MALLLAACQFDPSGLIGDGPGPGEPDARPDPLAPDASPMMIDANPDAPDAQLDSSICGWSFEPAHFDPCAADNPEPAAPILLATAGTWRYDTDDGTLTDPADVQQAALPVSDEGGVHTIWVQGFEIDAGATLRVSGDKPLMVVSTGDIVVNGGIDVSSGRGRGRGAGANASECPASPPGEGGQCNHGGGGGGGGGFGGAGGAGGVGGDGRNCGHGGSSGKPGGPGGEALGSPPERIRGGCAGRRGGAGDEEDYGEGGAGGGAVHLVARTRIEIHGVIHAGGEGGEGAEDDRSGGGGSGSGGFIGLEATEIELTGAVLAANGGGGGGGVDGEGGPMQNGDDGVASDEAAQGGPGQGNGGDGGDGSAGDQRDGETPGAAERGGGGGGGGAGFILVYHATPTGVEQATISPPLTPL